MKPELVSEERIRELCRDPCEEEECGYKSGGTPCPNDCNRYTGFVDGARTALEELGIVRIIELGKEEMYSLCDLDVRYSAVLVRAKEKP